MLTAGRPRVLGVLNLTPDSFSDGGLWNEPERAVEHAMAMLAAGAEVIDLGAESTRPGGGVYGGGARTVAAEEELERLLPVLQGLRRATDAPISVDTRKGVVAARALEAGADMVNDVSALGDPAMAPVVVRAGCPLVLMHSRGELSTMQAEIRFVDLLGEVLAELAEAVRRAEEAGVERGKLILDPGIGFGKTAEQNLALIRHLEVIGELGCPVMVGASRKSFIGKVAGGAPPGERLPGSLAAVGSAACRGAALVRVHDVAETVQFLAVWGAVEAAGKADEASREAGKAWREIAP